METNACYYRAIRRPEDRLDIRDAIKLGSEIAADRAARPIADNVAPSSMARSSVPCRRAESPGLLSRAIEIVLRDIRK